MFLLIADGMGLSAHAAAPSAQVTRIVFLAGPKDHGAPHRAY